MARARNIKPALFKNEVLGVADPILTLLFEGLWVLADRAGRLEDRPLRIRGEIFPYRDGINVNEMLDWLQEQGFVLRYKARGAAYIQVLAFEKHQNPHKNEPDSVIPGPNSDDTELGTIGTTSAKLGTSTDSSGSARADSLLLIPDPGSLSAEGVQGEASPSPAPTPAAPATPPGSPSAERRARMITLDTYLRGRKEAGEPAIPEGHESFAYAERVGIPFDFLSLQWVEFKRRYRGTSKKYIDWPKHYANSIRGNWFHLWRADQDGYVLTTVGLQAQRDSSKASQ